LQFETKTIPVKNGHLTASSKPVPIETQLHTEKMLGKVQSTAPKRPSTTTTSKEIRNNMLRKQTLPHDLPMPYYDQTASNKPDDEEIDNLPPTE
jgi:hypothetical protein